MKPSRTGVPRLPARARSRPRTLARPKLGRRLPPTLAVRSATAASPEEPRTAAAGAESLPAGLAIPAATKLPALPALPAVAAPPPVPQIAHAPNALVMRGDLWEVQFAGQTLMLEDSRGLRYIALLIRRGPKAGPLHAKELVALADGRRLEATELERPDEILDAVAQKQLLARLEELAAERDRATAIDDLGRAAALDEEHERLVDTLSRAAAPGSRRRKAAFSDAGEKARKAVAKAISEAIARIGSYPG